MRKLVIVLLLGVLCLLGVTSAVLAVEGDILTSGGMATGAVPEKYSEAPSLRVKVAAGELPPVSERLPEEPLVVEPFEAIGKYGGELLLLQLGVNDWGLPGYFSVEGLLSRLMADNSVVIPGLAKDWDFAADAKSLILYLRKGVKWSDGAPFTADDIMFWYNDVLLNEELRGMGSNAAYYGSWIKGGELVKVEKIDDYTVKYSTAVPWMGIEYKLSDTMTYALQGIAFYPAHYAKQFHIKYNPDADKLAQDNGYDHWYELFDDKAGFGRGGYDNLDLPVVGPWVLKALEPDHVTMVRNPYYWKVDTAGNQLPYIDTMKGVLAENEELRAAKAFAGEPDFVYMALGLDKLPLIKAAEKDLNYRSVLAPQDWIRPNSAVIFFNHCTNNEILRELYGKPKFLQALSLAMDRDELVKLNFMGLGGPRQATLLPPPITPWGKKEYGQLNIEYNPQKANQLLDEIGLDKKDGDGYRLGSDGKPLMLVLESNRWLAGLPTSTEMIVDYWNQVGIKAIAQIRVGWEFMGRATSGEGHALIWELGSVAYPDIASSGGSFNSASLWGNQFQIWFNTGGESGMEPPPKIKEFMEIWKQIPRTADENERNKMGEKGLKMLAENQWFIGVVGPTPRINAARITLGNVDLDAVTTAHIMVPYQWYWK